MLVTAYILQLLHNLYKEVKSKDIYRVCVYTIYLYPLIRGIYIGTCSFVVKQMFGVVYILYMDFTVFRYTIRPAVRLQAARHPAGGMYALMADDRGAYAGGYGLLYCTHEKLSHTCKVIFFCAIQVFCCSACCRSVGYDRLRLRTSGRMTCYTASIRTRRAKVVTYTLGAFRAACCRLTCSCGHDCDRDQVRTYTLARRLP